MPKTFSHSEMSTILEMYDDSISSEKNAQIIAPLLINRKAENLTFKLRRLKKQGILSSKVVNEVITQEVKIENDFHARLVEIIINHASADFKEKLFIGMLSKVGSGSGL